MPDATMKGHVHFTYRGKRRTANTVLDAVWHPERRQFDCELRATYMSQTFTAVFSITDAVTGHGEQERAIKQGVKNAMRAWSWKQPALLMETTYIRIKPLF